MKEKDVIPTADSAKSVLCLSKDFLFCFDSLSVQKQFFSRSISVSAQLVFSHVSSNWHSGPLSSDVELNLTDIITCFFFSLSLDRKS